jgi:hypothetical protein
MAVRGHGSAGDCKPYRVALITQIKPNLFVPSDKLRVVGLLIDSRLYDYTHLPPRNFWV